MLHASLIFTTLLLLSGTSSKASPAERSGLYEEGGQDLSGVPGLPEIDYPVYRKVPKTSFSCIHRPEGFYADPEARCQVFHVCSLSSGWRPQQSFLCPNGTLFNIRVKTCDWWNKVQCGEESDAQLQTSASREGFHQSPEQGNDDYSKFNPDGRYVTEISDQGFRKPSNNEELNKKSERKINLKRNRFLLESFKTKFDDENPRDGLSSILTSTVKDMTIDRRKGFGRKYNQGKLVTKDFPEVTITPKAKLSYLEFSRTTEGPGHTQKWHHRTSTKDPFATLGDNSFKNGNNLLNKTSARNSFGGSRQSLEANQFIESEQKVNGLILDNLNLFQHSTSEAAPKTSTLSEEYSYQPSIFNISQNVSLSDRYPESKYFLDYFMPKEKIITHKIVKTGIADVKNGEFVHEMMESTESNRFTSHFLNEVKHLSNHHEIDSLTNEKYVPQFFPSDTAKYPYQRFAPTVVPNVPENLTPKVNHDEYLILDLLDKIEHKDHTPTTLLTLKSPINSGGAQILDDMKEGFQTPPNLSGLESPFGDFKTHTMKLFNDSYFSVPTFRSFPELITSPTSGYYITEVPPELSPQTPVDHQSLILKNKVKERKIENAFDNNKKHKELSTSNTDNFLKPENTLPLIEIPPMNEKLIENATHITFGNNYETFQSSSYSPITEGSTKQHTTREVFFQSLGPKLAFENSHLTWPLFPSPSPFPFTNGSKNQVDATKTLTFFPHPPNRNRVNVLNIDQIQQNSNENFKEKDEFSDSKLSDNFYSPDLVEQFLFHSNKNSTKNSFELDSKIISIQPTIQVYSESSTINPNGAINSKLISSLPFYPDSNERQRNSSSLNLPKNVFHEILFDSPINLANSNSKLESSTISIQPTVQVYSESSTTVGRVDPKLIPTFSNSPEITRPKSNLPILSAVLPTERNPPDENIEMKAIEKSQDSIYLINDSSESERKSIKINKQVQSSDLYQSKAQIGLNARQNSPPLLSSGQEFKTLLEPPDLLAINRLHTLSKDQNDDSSEFAQIVRSLSFDLNSPEGREKFKDAQSKGVFEKR